MGVYGRNFELVLLFWGSPKKPIDCTQALAHRHHAKFLFHVWFPHVRLIFARYADRCSKVAEALEFLGKPRPNSVNGTSRPSKGAEQIARFALMVDKHIVALANKKRAGAESRPTQVRVVGKDVSKKPHTPFAYYDFMSATWKEMASSHSDIS